MKARSGISKAETSQCVKVGKGVSKCGCSSQNIQDSINSGGYTVFDVLYDADEGEGTLDCTLFQVEESNGGGKALKDHLRQAEDFYEQIYGKHDEL